MMERGMVEIFKGIADPRVGNAKKHKLEEILTIAILAVISGCTQFTEMELFGKERETWLRGFLSLENGIPSHDTFGDVFSAIKPEELRTGFMEWVETVRQKITDEVVAVDGKTICASKSVAENKKAVHVVSAWAAENGLVLGEIATDEKSNEITAIPKLLKLLELKDCIVTIDAMGTQREIAKTICEAQADYVLSVKENQPGLYEDITLYFSTEQEQCEYAKTAEKSHGRYETRECYVTTQIDWLAHKENWPGLSGIGVIRSCTQVVGKEACETMVHYVIFSKESMSAAELLKTKRAHWSIENSLHWVLDVDFGEDSMRMRAGYAAENMNIMRHLALNLLKSETSYRGSINLKRKKCMLSPAYLLKVFDCS
ncbi:ISAs1 family transposase [Diplocloster modestus]|uniref:ISAs1 family transposase n=1 Tax=Diplocloster modestus TaxID=2850322 RepID=A0ABS6K766_9FIRM|nr:ISAs1 family transposase [Diplocloster modestus]MBU9726348.1 ISAs1 family transposase [Diplocloster modestus]